MCWLERLLLMSRPPSPAPNSAQHFSRKYGQVHSSSYAYFTLSGFFTLLMFLGEGVGR